MKASYDFVVNDDGVSLRKYFF